jgi:hypothetical protein
MEGFYASQNVRKALMHRNKSTFRALLPRYRLHFCGSPVVNLAVASSGQLQLFQMDGGIDKIARRDVNRGNKRLFGLTYH